MNTGNAQAITMKANWAQVGPWDFSYKTSSQTFTAPLTGTYKIELWGAEGGSYDTTYHGGYGGYTAGTVDIEAGSTLYVFVGGKGPNSPLSSSAHYGGYNGGGGYYGSPYGYDVFNCTDGGGGATAISTVNSSYSLDTNHQTYIPSVNSLRARIMVAAGAGGGTAGCDQSGIGANAGGLKGYNASGYQSNVTYGGSQTAGGTGFKLSVNHATDNVNAGFGYGGSSGSNPWGGGGGGWYGGGSGGGGNGGGASGSSYISGMSGSIAVTSSGSAKCSAGSATVACSESWTGYVFTDPIMIDGSGHKWTATAAESAYTQMPNPSGGNYANGVGRSGNGYAKITFLSN